VRPGTDRAVGPRPGSTLQATMYPIGVRRIDPPRHESSIRLSDGRHLGYAEFGIADGPLVVWFHGSPGARRQIPPAAGRAAVTLGQRVVCIERPGIGMSTDHSYPNIRGWATDAMAAVDHLGGEHFIVVGLSGGGPYALAVAHEYPERVRACGLLGSVAPTVGVDGVPGGIVELTKRLHPLIRILRRPLGLSIQPLLSSLSPFAQLGLRGFSSFMPEGDQRVFSDPEIGAMFIDDLVMAGGTRLQAFLNDCALFGKHWDFELADVRVPVWWWHGDSDSIVPIDHARRSAKRLKNCELIVRPKASHLGDFAVAHEVLEVMARFQ
jgi:pimeloyl-ACP methyl ester carboxylesterase